MIASFRAKLAYMLRRRLGFPIEELALERLKHAGLTPQTVLDVGASYGLFADEIWRFWPNALIHCFEPEPEYVERLNRHAEINSKLFVCNALVGAKTEEEKCYFHHLGASSVLDENIEAPGLTTNKPIRKCTMISLDDYCFKHRLKPDFLKIDVQGYELEVLKGAEGILPMVDVVMTEVNHIEIYRNAPLAAELIGWLAERGYALHDIFNFMPRPLDGALWQSDMIFVRHSSPIRASKLWQKYTWSVMDRFSLCLRFL